MIVKWQAKRLALLFLMLFLCSCGSATAEGNQWIYFSQTKLLGLQKQLQQQYAGSVPIDAGRMRVLKVQQKGQTQPLYLIDTRVALESNRRELNPTCGSAGCAIAGYIEQGQAYREVLSVYLDPNPPQGKSLIVPTSTIQSGLPCLAFNQRKAKTRQSETIQWCYNGQRYQFVTSTLQR